MYSSRFAGEYYTFFSQRLKGSRDFDGFCNKLAVEKKTHSKNRYYLLVIFIF